MTGYLSSVWLHVLAAAAWIGSMVFFSAVVVPLLRRPELRENAPVLLRLLGARYRVFGWIALATLIATGVLNLYFHGFTWEVLSEASFWSQGFGRLLAWKLGLVVLVLVMTLLHEAVVGAPALDVLQREPGSARAQRIRRSASLLGRFVGIVSLVILWLAISMVRGL
jgi:uncharacterized membrane protein